MQSSTAPCPDAEPDCDAARLNQILQQFSADRGAHLHYLEAHLFKLPHKAAAMQAQRLFLLYLTVTGCDLLRAPWLPAHQIRNDNTKDSRCIDIAAELRACYDVHTGAFHAEHVTGTAAQGLSSPERPFLIPTDGVVATHCALHTLLVCGQLHDATRTWLSVAKTTEYVRRCQVAVYEDEMESSALHGSLDGGFRSAPDVDDVDVRFTYAALMTLQLLTPSQRLDAQPHLATLLHRSVCFVWRCWREAEGGFAATPYGTESHGGMTYCAVAALALAGDAGRYGSPPCWVRRLYGSVARRLSRSGDPAEDDVDSDSDDNGHCNHDDDHAQSVGGRVEACLGWCDGATWCRLPVSSHVERCSATMRPTAMLGFQGRPGKPCDSCYTHWLGGVLGTLRLLLPSSSHNAANEFTVEGSGSSLQVPLPVDAVPLLRFVHACCCERGGFGRHRAAPPDLVHTCLGLSGALLMAQLSLLESAKSRSAASGDDGVWAIWRRQGLAPPHPVLGCSQLTAQLNGMTL